MAVYTKAGYNFTLEKAAGIKIPWTKEEDAILKQIVHTYGVKQWTANAKEHNIMMGKDNRAGKDIRTGKQIRERWYNKLNPSIEKYTACVMIEANGLLKRTYCCWRSSKS